MHLYHFSKWLVWELKNDGFVHPLFDYKSIFVSVRTDPGRDICEKIRRASSRATDERTEEAIETLKRVHGRTESVGKQITFPVQSFLRFPKSDLANIRRTAFSTRVEFARLEEGTCRSTTHALNSGGDGLAAVLNRGREELSEIETQSERLMSSVDQIAAITGFGFSVLLSVLLFAYRQGIPVQDYVAIGIVFLFFLLVVVYWRVRLLHYDVTRVIEKFDRQF